MPRSAITWFEIPTRDLDRSQPFYEKLTGQPMKRELIQGSALAVFAYDEAGTGGCLQVVPEAPARGATATLVYLDANPSLDAMLARATAAGGSVATPRTNLPPGMGVFAVIEDLEGNRVGLHAMQ